MKQAFIAAIAAATLLFTSSVASAQFCVVGVMAAALYASAAQNRELTSREAMSCGLLLGAGNEAAKAKPKAKAKKKSARRAKRN